MKEPSCAPVRVYRGIRAVRNHPKLGRPGTSTIYGWMATRGFPRPYKFANGHSVAWDADEVDRWVDAQFKRPE